MNILCDLDSVLADFFSAALKDLNWHYRLRDEDAPWQDGNFILHVNQFKKSQSGECPIKQRPPPITVEEYIETKNPNMHEVWGITSKQFWAAIDYPNFWFYLQPFPWAKKLVKYLKSKGTLTIATAPGHIRSFSEKADWLRTHLDIDKNDIMIGKHKWLMARDDSVLIDDLPANVKEFRIYGGNAILVPSNWNKRDLSFEDVIGAIEDSKLL
jgi:5'(3')-deoxyribonucleotidase